MLVGKKISFKQLQTMEGVIDNAEIIDKYRGYGHVDFYLVSDSEGKLYHVLPKDIIQIY